MSHSSQGIYVPLPQSISDSDSEKEDRLEGNSHYITNGVNQTKVSFSQPKNGHITKDYGEDIDKFKTFRHKLSTKRKIALAISIVFCFLPIITFLWILPCNDFNTCSLKIPNWESLHENLEFLGSVNLVRGVFQKNLNLALMYKGSFTNTKPFKNGILSIMGTTGAIAWDFQQESFPIQMNCSIIDVDNNGYNDCLVVDSRGLKVVETISGEALWHAHSLEEKSIPEIDMPVKIEDLNKDGVSELLAIYKKSGFLIISGKTGQALKNIQLPSTCSSISLASCNTYSISYRCIQMPGNLVTYEVLLEDIKAKYYNSSANLRLNLGKNEGFETFYEVGDRKLTVENVNTCPKCQSTVTLYSANQTKLNFWTFDNSIVMQPVPFKFPVVKPNIYSSKGYITGFILKMWYWQDKSIKLSPVTRIYKRSVPVHNETYHLNKVSEQVLLLLLKENDAQLENVSLTDVYLICNGPAHSNCQPDYKNQENSILIADLDFDNSLELISYSSSYKEIEIDGYETWHLTSKLNVFRLESEFSKLFENK
ncbi:uncharacterized protein LOC114342683 [Diabrotica virgifera virgifera]|uniref:Uncharacterized protein LOC114342683 n=1 Tax=Diabrotica virgifera virgifera TaxID=50390 RepID=A0A6P7GHI2_DIAVI|nr:uncharacterized protein LOC114342683 [Diabrotica virgifera virgifera]